MIILSLVIYWVFFFVCKFDVELYGGVFVFFLNESFFKWYKVWIIK